MDPRAAIGFGLAFLGVAWVTSLACFLAVRLARSALRRLGPRAERRAAAIALVAAPLVGLAVAGGLAAWSAATPWLGLEDHCPAHGHHIHLCWTHGGGWASVPWAVVLVAAVSATLAMRAALLVADVVRGELAVRRIARYATRRAPDVLVAPARTPFCFAHGRRVYLSTATVDALDDEELAAVIAHERAHLAQRDPARRSWLGVAGLFGAPLVTPALLATWRSGAERTCDLAAARHTGDPTAVARALVAMTRLHAQPVAGLGFAPRRPEIEERVEALLSGTPDGAEPARRLAWLALGAYAILVAAAVLLADPLHHVLETVLGAF